LKFGIFALPTYYPDSDGTVNDFYKRVIDMLVDSERLGFAIAWANEHHFHPYGGMIPFPPVLLSAVAARTSCRATPCCHSASVPRPATLSRLAPCTTSTMASARSSETPKRPSAKTPPMMKLPAIREVPENHEKTQKDHYEQILCWQQFRAHGKARPHKMSGRDQLDRNAGKHDSEPAFELARPADAGHKRGSNALDRCGDASREPRNQLNQPALGS